jgi:hypothetical protein
MWFAPTNNEDRRVDDRVRTYKVKCKITIDSDEIESSEVDWKVWAYKDPATTRPSIAIGSDGLLIFTLDVDPQTVTGEVTGQDMTRNAATIKPDGMMATNSFYGKVIESHEARHVTQWTSINPWKDYYSPSKIYQLFAGKKKTGTYEEVISWQNTLITQAAQVLTNYNPKCFDEAERTHHHREHDAHALSNSVGPAYLKSNYATEYPNVQTPVGNAPEPTPN